MRRQELEIFFNTNLRPELFDDYCPNGLQIEGVEQISKIVFALSATKESAEYAKKVSANALIVHHGLFWKFHGVRTLTGTFYKRVAPLMQNNINLYAYHLPLDGQIEFGNAASIAKKLGLIDIVPFGEYKKSYTGVKGKFPKKISGIDLKLKLEKLLSHSALYSNPLDTNNEIESIGIVTGGANSQWLEASRLGLDAYLTGEMSEHDWHESREAGIHMYACGHHATERLGIIALMQKTKQNYPNIEIEYFESENPA